MFSLPPPVIVTVAVPYLLVSTVEVAFTVKLVAVSLAATVKAPAVLMVVPETPPSTVHVTVCAGLLIPVTVAVKLWVSPFATLAVDGFTVTPLTVGVRAFSGRTLLVAALVTLPV
jgi:hypothetical protein